MRTNACLKMDPAGFRALPDRQNHHRRTLEVKRRALSSGMMDEAIAGLLWMYLDVPEDASKTELEEYAREIVRRIHADASEAAIAEHIRSLQSNQLCQMPNPPAIRTLARRALAVDQGRQRPDSISLNRIMPSA